MTAISPLDGRYASKLDALRPFFSEEALMRARILVEISYFLMLSNEKGIKELPALNTKQTKALWKIVETFGVKEMQEIKNFEKKTNHDVKAVEYFLKKKMEKIPGLKKHLEFVHFSLTSEDVNNLSYGLMVMGALQKVTIPHLKKLNGQIARLGKSWMSIPLLSLTHGQPATPTTVGKEMMVFADRLQRQIDQLKKFKMQGKFGGAVATYSAHKAAYPKLKWEQIGAKFIRSLGLQPLKYATQINPHDDIAEVSHILSRIDTILLDFSRDMWMYISRGVFKQKVVAGEVGSSTMPHKVNPIDFENAEGNIGIANALFYHFAEKLPVSRLQRDLSDSTVQRSLGTAFGHHHLAVLSVEKGLKKVSLDRKAIEKELDEHPEVLAEAIQTVLRKNGVEGAYEKLKKLTRGAHVTRADFATFVEGLKLPKTEKERLLKLCK